MRRSSARTSLENTTLAPLRPVPPVTTRARILAKPVIEVQELDGLARAQLGDALYPVHRQIFDGVTRESFQRYVIDSNAARTAIQICIGEYGQPVGYTALHFFERMVAGQPATIIRCELGLLPAYRGRSAPGVFIIAKLVKCLTDSPGRPVYAFACPIHPSSYYAFSRHAGELWPRWDRETPRTVAATMLALADEFALPALDPARPMVRQVGWQTRQSDAEHQFWQAHSDPHVAFYLRENPDYRRGQGMLMFAPITFANVWRGARSLAHSQFRRGRKRRSWTRPTDRL